MEETNTQLRLERFNKVIELYRGMILDVVEQECGDSPRWQFIRNRLLRFLGQSGLHGKITLLLEEE
jgi:hypothetical protein